MISFLVILISDLNDLSSASSCSSTYARIFVISVSMPEILVLVSDFHLFIKSIRPACTSIREDSSVSNALSFSVTDAMISFLVILISDLNDLSSASSCSSTYARILFFSASSSMPSCVVLPLTLSMFSPNSLILLAVCNIWVLTVFCRLSNGLSVT